MGFGALLGTFPAKEKYPGAWGRGGPINTEARGRVAPGDKHPGPGRVGLGTVSPGARGWASHGRLRAKASRLWV